MRPLGLPGLARVRSPAGGVRERLRTMYWWQAHYLEALLDARDRAGGGAALERRIDRLVWGLRLANRGTLRRDFHDDMGWMGLALLRAGRRRDAEVLWGWIRHGWNGHQGGGICWRVQQPGYKNLPTNGPAALLAARLGDEAWAERIIDWLEAVLIDVHSGEVIDGIDRRGDGRPDTGWRFSYDYGLAVAVELVAGRREVAERIAAAGIARHAPAGILAGETGGGDGSLFKGIFARYLAELGTAAARSVVERSAEAYWATRDRHGRFGPQPGVAPNGPVELGAMLSGVLTLEAAARLAGPPGGAGPGGAA